MSAFDRADPYTLADRLLEEAEEPVELRLNKPTLCDLLANKAAVIFITHEISKPLSPVCFFSIPLVVDPYQEDGVVKIVRPGDVTC